MSDRSTSLSPSVINIALSAVTAILLLLVAWGVAEGNVIASSSFVGTSYRLDIGAVARGAPLVVRIEAGNRAKNFIVR